MNVKRYTYLNLLKNNISALVVFSAMASTLLPMIGGVDRTKFKNCEQSSFCQRHRKLQAFDDKWELDLASVKASGNNVIGILTRQDMKQLSLTLAITEKGAVRIKIDELNGARKRYEAKEALNPNLKFKKLAVPKLDGDQLAIHFGDETSGDNGKYKLLLDSSPFKGEVYDSQNRLVVALNSKGLFKFETYQGEGSVQAPALYGAPKQAQAYDETGKPVGDVESGLSEAVEADLDGSSSEVAGSYAETFSTFTDSRPYGPMSVGMDIHFPNSDNLYGIPEHADTFNLKDTRPNIGDPYRLYNVDIFEYELYNPMSLYGAIPFMIAHSKTVGSFGVLWLNPSETWIDIESNSSQSKSAGVVDMISKLVVSENKISGRLTHWFSETGLVDLWLTPGPDPETIMKYNAEILGTMPMPPLYSIGFHQCRWNYYSSSEIMQIERSYDEAEIPLDALWLDIEYTEGRSKKYFTWDPVAFVDHIKMANNLTANGRRLIAIIDPHIKKEDGYSCYDEGKANSLWLKDSRGNDYEAWCWPGASYWPDYLSPQVRDWWASKFEPAHFPGDSQTSVDIWNDMNEPSVFDGPEVTMPRDLKHVEGFEHRDLHNMYGFLMTMGTYKGLSQHRSHLNRPFILTRSFFAGSQRYAAAWTGDNRAVWEHLKISVPMLLSLSVAGMPFVGADVGGFFTNPESDELIIRWHQAGAMQPFFRNHAHHDSRHREIYRYTGQTRNLLRNAVQLRYSYAPYWYTLFFEAHASGMPMMRPCWFHDPTDERTFDQEEQYCLGKALLVRPVLEKSVETVPVYLPKTDSSWYDLNYQTMHTGGKTLDYKVNIATVPIFQRAGTIVPRKYRMRKSLELGADDPITLDVVLEKHDNKNLLARGHVFVDDHKSLQIGENNAYLRDIVFENNVFKFQQSDGSYKSPIVIERIVIYNWPSSSHIESVTVSSGNDNFKTSQKLHFDLDTPRLDGTVRLDIKRPQPSANLKTWIVKIETKA